MLLFVIPDAGLYSSSFLFLTDTEPDTFVEVNLYLTLFTLGVPSCYCCLFDYPYISVIIFKIK